MSNINEYNIEILYPKIWVAKNAIKNCKEVIDYFEKSYEWVDWYGLGKMTREYGVGGTWNHFPNEEEFKEQILNRDEKYKHKVDKIIYEISKIYVENNNIEYDTWRYPNWGVAMYETNCGVTDKIGMNYHTDFVQHETEKPGWKFGITMVIYGNDNYDGGEISFKILKDNNYEEVDKEFNYKPKEGDVLIFPSDYPYLHAAQLVTSGTKYIFRLYWLFESSGSDTWKLLISKYEDKIEELEKKRIHYILKEGGGKEINGAFFPKESLTEYYDRLNLLKLEDN
jgi:hypothetical protein